MGVFDSRVVIVTGGGRGLGRVYAHRFAADGAAVVVADIDGDSAKKVAAELDEQGASVIAVAADLTDPAAAAHVVESGVAAFGGGVDFLINNAALYGDLNMGPLLDTEPDYFDTVLRVNVKSVWLMTRAVAPIMRARRYGRVVNISSIGAWTAGGMYCLSKLAVHQLTYSLAKELGAFSVTVNAVAPGAINNETTQRKVPAGHMDDLLKDTFIKRFGTADDVYGAIHWLCSDAGAWVTGQVISPNGGSHTSF